MTINKKCTCGKYYLSLPVTYKLLEEGSELDGFYFECTECQSTMMVPKLKTPAQKTFTGDLS